jgi:predicted DNA-binding protein
VIAIRVPETLVTRLDAVAKARGTSRVGLLNMLIEAGLPKYEAGHSPLPAFEKDKP